MKLSPLHRRLAQPDFKVGSHRSRAGIALVIVLSMLVLITGLVLAFFTSVTTELGSARVYVGALTARQAADQAVAVVQSQIASGAGRGADYAWASQPGMLRTYDVSGTPVEYYKLFSSNAMVGTGTYNPTADLAVDWDAQPAIFTDLNSPILEPNPADPDLTRPVFPIVDPRAKDLAVEGFDYTAGVNGADTSSTGDARRLPMPVRWIYVLRDGSLVAPEGGAGRTANLGASGGTAPSVSNPIVGRVAFWTDDESSKVNLNTASEGTYWDTPVANAGTNVPFDGARMSDFQLAYYQGAQKEYHRYPGHPATTSLSTIFGGWLPSGRGGMVQAITDLIPRVNEYNQPEGGTVASSLGATRRATGVLAPDSSRLYASVDELIFKGAPRDEQSFGSGSIKNAVEQSKFFLTANSRAPEENLYGKPRVAIWPITTPAIPNATSDAADIGNAAAYDRSKMTVFDQLIARAATVGIRRANFRPPAYYFQRQDPHSATADWAQRNIQLYTYLQNLTGRPIPGFGGTFSAKYQADRNQILTQIFDYIRSTNLVDTTGGDITSYTPPDQGGDFTTLRGQVVPIEPTGVAAGTRGFGRIATISELAVFIVNFPRRANEPTWAPTHSRLEVALIPELFSPMAGFSALSQNMRIKFTEIDLTITDAEGVPHKPFGAGPFPSIYDAGRISSKDDGVSKVGGPMGFGSYMETAGPAPYAATPADSVPPTAELTIAGTGDQTIRVGGTVKIDIEAPVTPAAKTQVIQQFTITIPTMEVKIPQQTGPNWEFADGGTASAIKGGRLTRGQAYKLNTIVHPDAGTNRANETDTLDSIRSVVPIGKGIKGDMRQIAARKVVEGYFDAPDGAMGTIERKFHNLLRSYATGRGGLHQYAGYKAGELIIGLTNPSPNKPDVPPGISGVTNSAGAQGDWDNGQGLLPDGPYLNKADEGSELSGSAPYISEWFWQQAAIQDNTFFSPNRQMASPVMFGSLPTGVLRNLPWQTLLFRPAQAYLPGGANHPGSAAAGPPDHLLLDLFWMPIVEPYAISEPFSTAGKINMNYQIAPFSYITRETAMRAAMKSVLITALPNTIIDSYKSATEDRPNVSTRLSIDMDRTLEQFTQRFTNQGLFKSATEICDIPLYPVGQSNLSSFWDAHRLTGDNSLERPYAHLYPRLTTKSNTYTVHVRAQSLKKVTNDPAQNVWNEDRDQVTGEYRGAFLLERYVDQNLAGLYAPDGAASDENNAAATLGPYRFRIISSKQFGQ